MNRTWKTIISGSICETLGVYDKFQTYPSRCERFRFPLHQLGPASDFVGDVDFWVVATQIFLELSFLFG